MSENKVGRPSRSEPRHVFYFNKPTYEVWTRLKSKVSRSSGEKSLSSNEIALWLLQSYETRFTDSCTRCAKINSENINDDADGIKENSQDGDVHSRSVASFCSGSTARPQSTDVAQAPLTISCKQCNECNSVIQVTGVPNFCFGKCDKPMWKKFSVQTLRSLKLIIYV